MYILVHSLTTPGLSHNTGITRNRPQTTDQKSHAVVESQDDSSLCFSVDTCIAVVSSGIRYISN